MSHRTCSNSASLIDKLPSELHLSIASHLLDDGQASLYNSILVNKQWFLRLIDLLWKKPPQKALLFCNCNSHRMQYYASKVRVIERLDLSDGLSTLYRNLRFTAVQRVKVQAVDSEYTEDWIEPFLQPTLQILQLVESHPLTPAMLDLMSRFTQLRELDIYDCVSVTDTNSFIDFLRACQSLRKIHVGAGFRQTDNTSWLLGDTSKYRDITAEIIPHLLKCENVKNFALHQFAVEGCAPVIDRTSSYDLPSSLDYQILHLHGGRGAIMPFLSRATTRLEYLILGVESFHDSVFPCLSGLKNLVLLDLRFWQEDVMLSSNDLAALTQLSRLQSLNVIGLRSRLDVKWMTDDYFDDWISHFPDLHRLELWWLCDTVTESVIASIANSCPHLSWCKLGWKQDLRAWDSLGSKPLLRNLNNIWFASVKELLEGNAYRPRDLIEEAEKIIQIVFNLAPNIEHFIISGKYGSPSAQALHDAAAVKTALVRVQKRKASGNMLKGRKSKS